MSDKQITVHGDSPITQQETEGTTGFLEITISGEFDKKNLADIFQIQQQLAQKLNNIKINIVDPDQAKINLDREINQQLQDNYRLAVVEHEEKYKAALKSKDEEISVYKEQTKRLKEIIEDLSQNPIVIKQDLDRNQ